MSELMASKLIELRNMIAFCSDQFHQHGDSENVKDLLHDFIRELDRILQMEIE